MEWNFRPGKAVIPRMIYPHVQVPNVGNYPMPGIDCSSDARRARPWLTRLLSFRREIHVEFQFADDPFVNLMNIFTFHFTENLCLSLWVFLLCLDIINFCHAKSVQLFWVGWLFYLCVAFMFGNLYYNWSLSVLRRYFLPHRMFYWFL
jgi:hypothetical protein